MYIILLLLLYYYYYNIIIIIIIVLLLLLYYYYIYYDYIYYYIIYLHIFHILIMERNSDLNERIQKRSVVLKNARKISHQSGFNSIDAQIMVNSDAPTPSKGDTKNQTKLPDEESTKRPVLLDVAPLQMALKRFDVLSPYVDSVFGETDRIDVRDVLDRFRLGGIVDRYHHVYDHFADEMDALRCTCEYLLYTLFNHRLSSGTPAASSSRGLQDDVMNLVVDAAASFLRNDNSSQLIRDVWNLLPARGEIVFPVFNSFNSANPVNISLLLIQKWHLNIVIARLNIHLISTIQSAGRERSA